MLLMSEEQASSRATFPKSAKLTRSCEFSQVREAGHSASGKFFLLGCKRTTSDSPTRIGIITSKRLGNAVVRNRVRRRLREIVRLSRAHLEQGLWLVLVARRAAADAPLEILQQEWMRLGKRCSIFKP